jgi:hypothetical protein
MSRKAFSPRISFCLVFIVLLSACGGTGELPAAVETSIAPTQSVATTAFPTSPPVSAASPEPAIPERRFLALEFPPRIRAGDSDIVRLTLEMDESGTITPTAVVDGNVVTGEAIEIPNLYETHHVVAEARFDMAGMQVAPPELSSQTLFPGQSIMFFWSIRPNEVGLYRGTVWLFLRFVDKVSGAESQRAVSAQMVEIEAVNLFGVPARVVRSVGAVGSVVGAVVGFPFFEDIVKYLYKRRQKRKK